MNPCKFDVETLDKIIDGDKYLKDYCKKNNITDPKSKEIVIENRYIIKASAKSGRRKPPLTGVVKLEPEFYKIFMNKYHY